MWGEREQTVGERERAQVAPAHQSARREKRMAELLQRAETDEKIRKSFIHFLFFIFFKPIANQRHQQGLPGQRQC